MIYSDLSYNEAQPQTVKVSTIPPLLSHMMVYGLLGGVVLGMTGLLLFFFQLDFVLSEAQTLSVAMMRDVLMIQVVALVSTLFLLLCVLRLRWQAPSWHAKFTHGASIGFVLTLAMQFFLRGINGAFYHRDMWIGLHRTFDGEDRAFIELLYNAVYNTFYEGMTFQIALLIGLSLLGGVFGLLLLRRNPNQDLPQLKDAFGAVAAVVLPLFLIQVAVVNWVVFAVLNDVMRDIQLEHGFRQSADLIGFIMTVPAFALMLVFQLASVLWVVTINPSRVHGYALKIAKYVVACLPIALTMFMAYAIPEVVSDARSLWFFVPYFALSWLFAAIAHRKGQQMNPKRGVQVRGTVVSLLMVAAATYVLIFLLMDYFTTGAALNLVLYAVVFITPMLGESTMTAAEVLHPATIGMFGYMGFAFLIGLLGYCIPMTICLWAFNRAEK